jgi:hypothetical protein
MTKKRKPYQWGAKEYLFSFKIGETRVCSEFPIRNLATMASKYKRLLGMQFTFNNKNKTITRLDDTSRTFCEYRKGHYRLV